LTGKFMELAEPVLGAAAKDIADAIWGMESAMDLSLLATSLTLSNG
jgi:hypothetical protein